MSCKITTLGYMVDMKLSIERNLRYLKSVNTRDPRIKMERKKAESDIKCLDEAILIVKESTEC